MHILSKLLKRVCFVFGYIAFDLNERHNANLDIPRIFACHAIKNNMRKFRKIGQYTWFFH